MSASDFRGYIARTIGADPGDLALYDRAFTHSSTGKPSYDRLEFLGDRVLGMTMARWLYDRFADEKEGELSNRFNALVARETCAEVGRSLHVPQWIRLGRQARDDGASQSDNVVGDVVEALIGALLLDKGMPAAEARVRAWWAPLVDRQSGAPQHPKSALQELAAAKGRKPPVYALVSRTGAHHAPVFTVTVTVPGLGDATGEGTSKQEAETAAATTLLERLQ